MRRSREQKRSIRNGLLFVSPWIVGFLVFIAYPVCSSVYYSFTDYNGLNEGSWVGLANYKELFTEDPLYMTAVGNTLYYVLFSLLIGQTAALALALLLNRGLREIALYRVLYYIPSVLPGVAVTFLWIFLMDAQYGMVNGVIAALGGEGPGWMIDPQWAKLSLVLLAVWTGGQGTIIYLSGLGNIPKVLYESAEIDGASPWRRLTGITLPLISPQILLSVILGTIGGFKVFTSGFISGGSLGNPQNSTLFYSTYIYHQAFKLFHMGYASAMAWILAIATLLAVLVTFRLSRKKVHYMQDGGIA
ncbi:carbohydrate ABC transporter permease [Paenibacillus ginsengarvi]|uniref:Sugar ABC transporter permease n=1 Tax=Paenibacillus ginsengarvi TaxID=400777 RepID=A0A3B0CKI1_9BACL|nr:sugar ABC transporter permease [Paenibacillus ginsengarvi]RKN85490.1 sugar ABC transporter permease [Paenibacillus ginsengarvi]